MAVSLRSLLNSATVQASRHTHCREYLDILGGRWENYIMSIIINTPCITLRRQSNQEDELEGACSTCETTEMHTHKKDLKEAYDFDNLQGAAKILNYVQKRGWKCGAIRGTSGGLL
jgi:hypothetical protein